MANWLTFDRIRDWEILYFPGFQYDDIADESIATALADTANLEHVRPELDWQADSWLSQSKTVPNEQKHAYRVAALVRDFSSGNPLSHGISIDTFNVSQCRSGIGDGHHRIRALQYLGFKAGPFWLAGYVEPLLDLLRLAGTKAPELAHRYCAPELVLPSPDDMRLDA